MARVELIPLHRSFRDKLGRTVFLRPYEEVDFKGLSAMYDEFKPKNIVAVLENRIVGHAALDMPLGTNAREYMIFVHQDYQNKGIGQALTFSMLEAAREMDTRKVWVVVDNLNRIAITVFKKAGFLTLPVVGRGMS